MKLYCYSENCTSAGRIYRGEEDPAENGDLFLWGEGTEEELIGEAINQLDPTLSPFTQKCARNVLHYFGEEVPDA